MKWVECDIIFVTDIRSNNYRKLMECIAAYEKMAEFFPYGEEQGDQERSSLFLEQRANPTIDIKTIRVTQDKNPEYFL